MAARKMIGGCDGDRSLALPDHLLEEILVRVPAETLGPAQLVSKRWRRIISDRCFVFLHARRWSTKPRFLVATTLILVRRGLMPYLPLDPHKSNKAARRALSYTSNLGLDVHHLDASLRATCSGLAVFTYDICYHQRVIAVGNPTTKSYINLPICPLPTLYALYGLAFDVGAAGSATAFTVVVLETHELGDGAAFSIITFPELKWRRVEHFFSGATLWRAIDQSVYCAGKLHWPVTPGGRVLAFDVATDEASVLDHPTAWKPRTKSHLGSVGGRLSLTTLEEGCIRIWALADYGGRGAWTLDRQIMAPCGRPLTILLCDGDICALAVQHEEIDEVLYSKLMVHRINGDDTVQWEEPWPPQSYWTFTMNKFLPHCTTMLTIQK